MAGDFCTQSFLGRARRLSGPQVFQRVGGGGKVRVPLGKSIGHGCFIPRKRKGFHGGIAVQGAHGPVAPGERLEPDFDIIVGGVGEGGDAQGILVQVLNPKTAIFFFAFLPQFVQPARGSMACQFLALGLLFLGMGFLSDSLWALTAGSAAGWLRRNPKFLRNQHYVSGGVYLGLGLATALGGSRHA